MRDVYTSVETRKVCVIVTSDFLTDISRERIMCSKKLMMKPVFLLPYLTLKGHISNTGIDDHSKN